MEGIQDRTSGEWVEVDMKVIISETEWYPVLSVEPPNDVDERFFNLVDISKESYNEYMSAIDALQRAEEKMRDIIRCVSKV